MSRTNILRVARIAQRNAFGAVSMRQAFRVIAAPRIGAVAAGSPSIRAFASSSINLKGIQPETADPETREVEPETPVKQATDISTDQFHEVADTYLNHLIANFEEIQEAREDVDVEYSAGIVTLIFPPIGTYVINKQPPNKQIWLSSPISGPKRYDWVMLGESQNQKEGGGKGEWVYLRDGSTLNQLIEKEIGVDLTETLDEM